MISRLLFTFLVLTSFIFAQLPTSDNLKKLDPKFIPLLQNKSLQKTNVKTYSKLNAVERTSDNNVKYGAFIYTDKPDALRTAGITVHSFLPGFVTSHVTPGDLEKLINNESVRYIKADHDEYPMNDAAAGMIGADLLRSGYVNGTPYKGSGIIVAIIDTGIDWDHFDFRDPVDTTKSRILYIWDQTITAAGSETVPAPYGYGVEYTKAQIEDEFDGTPAGFVRERDINGHGSHVAGSAAGNGAASAGVYSGMAPEADIIFVKAGNGSFSTTNIVNGLAYIKAKANELGKPVVVNMSLGSNFGPHDGTDPKSVAINNFCGAGKVVIVSAGNDGDALMHVTRTIPAGNFVDIPISISAYTATAGANNDYAALDGWIEDNSDITASVISPAPNSFVTTQAPGSFTDITTDDGSVYINNVVDVTNSDRNIYIEIYDGDETKPPLQGTWTVRLTNTSGSDKTFHGWLFTYRLGGGYAEIPVGDPYYTLGNSADKALIVGSYVSKWRWFASDGNSYYYGTPDRSDNISVFSSIGPTRDGRQKPDIAAPGQAIVSVNSSDAGSSVTSMMPGLKYQMMQGTSMASPVTAGAAALLLEQNSSLSDSDVKTLINTTADLDSYTGAVWNDTWGFGKLDIFKAMVKDIDPMYEMDRKIFAYDEWNANSNIAIAPNDMIAVKFSPDFIGKVTGCLFHSRVLTSITGPLYAEIWSDNSGAPGVKLGSTVTIDQNKVKYNAWNNINMTGANVNVNSGENYFIVLYYTSGTSTITIAANSGNEDNRSYVYTAGAWSVFTHDFRIRAIVTKDISTLPVEITSFTSTSGNNQVTLNWSTATEINSYKFEVERKLNDGKGKWQKIGEVFASGNSNSPKDYSYIDKNLPTGEYSYRLKMIDIDGTYDYSETIISKFSSVFNSALFQNSPNPFNPVTTINYQIASMSHVQLKIYDMLGREIAKLVDSEQPAGNYSVKFDGSRLAAGVYFYNLEAGNFSAAKKLILMK